MNQNSHHIFIHKRNHILARNRKNRKKSMIPKSSLGHISNFNCFCLQEEHNAQLAKEILIVESHFDDGEEEYESFRPQKIKQKACKLSEKVDLDFIVSQKKNQNCQLQGINPQNKVCQQKSKENVEKQGLSPKIKISQQSPNLKKKSYQSQGKKSEELKRRGNASLVILNKNPENGIKIKTQLLRKDEKEKEKSKSKQRVEMNEKILSQNNKSQLKLYPQYFSQNYLNMAFPPANIKVLRGKQEIKKEKILDQNQKNQQRKRRTVSQTQYLTNIRNYSFQKESDFCDNQQLNFKDSHMKSFNTIQNERGVQKIVKRLYTETNTANFRFEIEKSKPFRSTGVNAHTYSTKSVVQSFINGKQKEVQKEQSKNFKIPELKWMSKIKQSEESTKSHSELSHMTS